MLVQKGAEWLLCISTNLEIFSFFHGENGKQYFLKPEFSWSVVMIIIWCGKQRALRSRGREPNYAEEFKNPFRYLTSGSSASLHVSLTF